MISSFQWFSIVLVLVVTFAGGFPPLRRGRAGVGRGLPAGEAFASGVFLALSLAMMLPAAYTLMDRAFPQANYPIASLVTIGSFLALLGISSLARDFDEESEGAGNRPTSPLVPVIMTLMIAIPSFFLGTALGVSPAAQALLILVAILLHKSSAAFALALRLVQSSLSQGRAWLVFCLFAFATPIGILVGGTLIGSLNGQTVLAARGFVLAMAAGAFLFLATVGDRSNRSVGRDFRRLFFLACGALLTGLVRFVIGEAHSLG